jgi:hypothetical protein
MKQQSKPSYQLEKRQLVGMMTVLEIEEGMVSWQREALSKLMKPGAGGSCL